MGGVISGSDRQVLKKLAENYSSVDFDDLSQLYNSLKKRNESGKMNRDDLERSLPKTPNKKILDSLYVFFDTDQDGTISIIEYIVGITKFCFGTPNEKLKYVFTIFDLNRDGFLSKGEMKEGLNLICQVHPKNNQKMVEKIFRVLDENHDGLISLEEFQKVVLKNPKLCSLLTNAINPHF